MQVYFSWQLQSVLGNLKLFFRVSTPKFQSTGMSAQKKDKMSCAGSTGRGFYHREDTVLCAAQPLLLLTQTADNLHCFSHQEQDTITRGLNWKGFVQGPKLLKVSFVSGFQNK